MVASIALETFMTQRIFHCVMARCLFVLLLFVMALPASAKTYGVVVAGIGGTVEFDEAFGAAAQSFGDGLRSLDSDASLVITLDGSAATREAILQSIESQAARIQSDIDEQQDAVATDPVFVLMLTGHGNADKDGWRFNVPGPDIRSDDLIAALNAVPTARQLVVLAASASGAVLDSMSQLGRVLVTATKSGGEINAIRFHEFLAEAVSGDVADYDRNEILTIAEAYRFADARTRDYYEQQKLLASEHSRLRGAQADDIAIALLGSLQDARDDPVVAELLEQRLGLEQQFKSHRLRKPDMPLNVYYDELEVLLLSIARLQQSIDKATGWSDRDAES